MNAIQIAFKGHVKRLKAIHGSNDPDDKNIPNWIRQRQKGRRPPQLPPDGKAAVLTPDAFDKMFGRAAATPRMISVPKDFKAPRLSTKRRR